MSQEQELCQNKDVWVVVEHSSGKIKEVTLEMLYEGKRLAGRLRGKLCAVIIGCKAAGLIKEIEGTGAEVIYLIQDVLLDSQTPESCAIALIDLIQQYHPSIIIIGATADGSELAARVATQLGVGLVTGCTALEVDENSVLRATRPIYENKVYSTTVWKTALIPRIATIRPGAIGVGKLEPAAEVHVMQVCPSTIVKDTRIQTIGYIKAEPASLDLAEGDIVVAGGHGAKSEQSWHHIEELADALGAVIGGTRRALDNGHITRDRLVGQTGRTIKPKLYLAVGISGASHHTEGMKDAEHIIAINNEPTAQIFKLAHLCILADLNQLLPELTMKVNQYKKTHAEGFKG